MLKHATYLENVALRLHHNVVQTLSPTLAGTNTAKFLDLLKGTFPVDLPSMDEEDDVKVESNSEEEEEEQFSQTGTASWVAAQSADSAKFTNVPLLFRGYLLPRSKVKANNSKRKGQRLNWNLKQNH